MTCKTTLQALILLGCALPFWGGSPAVAVGSAQTAAPCAKADAELNRVYKQVRAMYKNDPQFLQHLKVAQRAWIKFRDAHMSARYPLDPDYPVRGAEEKDCMCYELASLTGARTAQLEEWLKGTEEGDVCAGSLRRTPPK